MRTNFIHFRFFSGISKGKVLAVQKGSVWHSTIKGIVNMLKHFTLINDVRKIVS